MPRQPSIVERNTARAFKKEKDNADRYINPPQGQQSNLRLAQKHLDLAEKHWRKWEGIAQSAMNELPEGAGYNEAVTAWEVTQTANATWIQTAQNTIEAGVQTRAQQRETALATQKYNKLKIDVDMSLNQLEARVKSIADHLPNELTPLAYQTMNARVKAIDEELEKKTNPALNAMYEADPSKHQEIQTNYGTKMTNLHASIDELSAKLAGLVTDPAHYRIDQLDGVGDLENLGAAALPNNSSSQQKGNYSYLRRAMPTFSGKIRDFPRWLNEWQKEIAPRHSDAQLIDMINNHTPDTIKLSHCNTAEECFEKLKSRYGNPSVVAAQLIREFMNWKPKSGWSDANTIIHVEEFVAGLLKDLEVINQKHQLTENQLMTDTLVLMLPYKYREKLIEVKIENDELPQTRKKALWDLAWDFVKATKSGLEENSPWLIGTVANDILDQYEGAKDKSSNDRKFCQKWR